MQASRAVRLLTFVFGVLGAGVAAAATPALVVDVDSGKVLYAERATDPWYPASITKLMTVFVALSAVRDGRASLDTPITVSELSASMPPSKMGFRPGTEITLDNALKIIMVKSANDIAMTIAEGLGGSVDGFADMMNAAAQQLGMRESHFVNPHGLPDERNHTSARDMAILGRALLRDFPEYSGYFHIGAIKFGRRVMSNHNGLIGRYAGADGMKTGFICSGGFNVVASATRNGRRLITVVLGSPSAAERTVRAASLLDQGFASFGWSSQTLETLPASTLTSPPDMRPIVCERHRAIPAEEDAQPALLTSQGGSGPENGGLLPAHALAFSTFGNTPGTKPQLGPRARLETIPVWVGRTPPTAMAAQEEDEKPTGKPAPKLKQKPLARAAKAGVIPAAAQAFTATEPKSIIDDGKGGATKDAIQPSAALNAKLSSGAARTKKVGALATDDAQQPKAGATAARSRPKQPTRVPLAAEAKLTTGRKAAVVTGGRSEKRQAATLAEKKQAKASERKAQVGSQTKPRPTKAKPESE
jgi:D-alanyl-D-alanine carboxypeptidase